MVVFVVISRIGKAQTEKGMKFLAVNIFFVTLSPTDNKNPIIFVVLFCIFHQTDYKLFRRFLQKQFSDRECLDIGDSGVLAL